jgi:hypothetical protein
MADDVQPVEGQGAEAPGIFDAYLQAVPEEARESVTGYLKDAEKNVNERLAEASELKKTWEPYQQVEALKSYPPEQLSELLAWHQQVTASDEAFQSWLAQAAEDAGFTKAEAKELEEAEETGALDQKKIEQLVAERFAQQVQPLEQRLTDWEKTQQTNAIEAEISDDFGALEAEHKVKFSDDQKKAILDLGIEHQGEGSWVKHGFERFQKLAAESQRAFVAEKSGNPESGLSAGGQEAFKPPTSFEDAGKQLRERLRQPS